MARDFTSGSSERILLSSAPASAVPLTIAGWSRFDTAMTEGAEYTICAIDDPTTGHEFTVEIGRNGGVDYAIVVVTGASTQVVTSSVAPLINTWNHLCGVFTSSTSRDIYLNGTNVGNGTTNITPTVTETSIGATDQGASVGKFYDGQLAEIGIWTRVLTSAEITSLSQGFAPSTIPQNLVFYAPLIGQNTPEATKIPNGTAMTMTGTTKYTHPDFMKYPNKPSTGIRTRPAAFSPGLAR